MRNKFIAEVKARPDDVVYACVWTNVLLFALTFSLDF